jgi:hypothetical protein
MPLHASKKVDIYFLLYNSKGKPVKSSMGGLCRLQLDKSFFVQKRG